VACRLGTPEQAAEARRELEVASLEDHIQRVVDSAPPLTADQRARLGLLLAPGRPS